MSAPKSRVALVFNGGQYFVREILLTELNAQRGALERVYYCSEDEIGGPFDDVAQAVACMERALGHGKALTCTGWYQDGLEMTQCSPEHGGCGYKGCPSWEK